jgi:hypothetical protein
LSFFARVFFRVPLGDVYCGLRAMRRALFDRLVLQSSGMEFALEMIVKSRLLGAKISETPTTLEPDGRDRPPHLNTWRDGRRSLLLYVASMSSGFLLYPGGALMILGLVSGAVLAIHPVAFYNIHFNINTLLYSGAAVLLGFQLVTYAIALRFLMVTARLLPPDLGPLAWVLSRKLEHGLAAGLMLILMGLCGVLWLVGMWGADSFGDLDPFLTMRIAIPSATAITLGLQVAFAALFLSLAKWQVKTRASG